MSTTRRRLLHTLSALPALAALPALGRGAPLRVAIAGGGMAGMAAAWLLDGLAEVTVFEAAPQLGGNVRSVPYEQDGLAWSVDLGAQYFHPEVYPAYTALLTDLGLFPDAAHAFDASITVDRADEPTPRFVSPLLPGRAWPLLAPWNRAGLQAFQRLTASAGRREARGASYALAMADWLPRLGLDAAQTDGILLPWTAALYSGVVADAQALSARAAMTYLAGARPDRPTDPVRYWLLRDGMAEPLRRMAALATGVHWRLGQRVTSLQRLPDGRLRVQANDGGVLDVDQLVLAASAEPSRALLAGLPGTEAMRAALARMPFHEARLMLHTDPAYVRADPALHSFLNVRVDGPAAESSMDLSRALAPGPAGQRPTLWKSWVTQRAALPSQVLHDSAFRHFLPTPDAIAAQADLAAQQGAGGIWVVGGYTRPYDAQETALQSALDAVVAMMPAVRRRQRWQAVARPRSQAAAQASGAMPSA